MSEGGSDSEDDFQPQADGLAAIEGYGEIGFSEQASKPPPPPVYEPPEDPPKLEFGNGGVISEQEAREALLARIAEECCWGKRAAENMVVNSITPSNGLHYKLETFCEGRNTYRKEEPYFGGQVDGPFNGPPPLPWDIPCTTSKPYFVDAVYHIRVPHTDEVRQCGRCVGSGHVPCPRCRATGRVRCGPCGGRGRHTRHRDGNTLVEPCHACGGSGRRVCHRCGGSCRVQCKRCRGTGRVCVFIELRVTFTNHVESYVKEDTDMPDQLVTQVSGDCIFNEHQFYVTALTTFPAQEINANSQAMIHRHMTAFNMERRLDQRHSITAVPVSEVAYQHGDEHLRFWVYGRERRCHCPDYPHQCCWGCNIL